MTKFQKEVTILKALIIVCSLVWILFSLASCGGVDKSIPVASVLSSGRITLSWNEVPGAASYNVYMSNTPGITTLNSYKISDVTTPITITDLEPGTTYYFIVAVFNDAGESRQSKELSYTVAETEGSIEFGDILENAAPDDNFLQSAKMPDPDSAEEAKPAKKAEPLVLAAPKDQTGSDIIICFGDSLTAGTGANSGMDYPSQLAGMIGKPVINKGVPGDTTANALRRLQRDVLSANPDIVLITLGGNDLKNGVSKNIAFNNLKYIVNTIQQQGANVVIGGLKFPGMDRGFGKGYADLAKQTGAALIPDIFDGIVDNPDLMSDPIHPNNAGYRIIARRFSTALAPIINTRQAGSKTSGAAAITKSGTADRSGTPATRDVTLAWDNVPNATSYNIYWRDRPGVNRQNGTKIANVKNPHKMKGLKKGKKYYFVVTAVNQSGESKESEEFSFTP